MKIREARIEDLEELLEIYNYEVINGVATLDLEPKGLEDRRTWFYQHNAEMELISEAGKGTEIRILF